jgi:hypothetical protein
MTIDVTEEVVSKRERSESNANKIIVLKAFLDIVAEEDVDSFFITVLNEAQSLGYRLKNTPEKLCEELTTG